MFCIRRFWSPFLHYLPVHKYWDFDYRPSYSLSYCVVLDMAVLLNKVLLMFHTGILMLLCLL
jgi:hypothetical protein